MTRQVLVVRGRVQGVGFRASCAAQARRLGLDGWVRNLADGSVQVLADGPAAAVEALISWCRHGPPLARVDDVAVLDVDDLHQPAPTGVGEPTMSEAVEGFGVR